MTQSLLHICISDSCAKLYLTYIIYYFLTFRNNIEELISACRRYVNKTGRRISFEYSLVRGVNDTPEHAEKLCELLKGILCHVNLIPVNPVEETGFDRSDDKAIKAFAATLEKKGVRATVRRKLGADINAACGQLRRADQKSQS